MSGRYDPNLFREFFLELHGYLPFPWQERLAGQVVETGWPGVIDLPTASGKTACIDIALFALACGRGFRRMFFIVDRKVIVDEAYERAKRISGRIDLAKDGALGEIRKRLVQVAGGESNKVVHVCELRGGVYRDESWVRSPLQPTVVASTVDQVGSRLLFRGYGISSSSQPIHAALIGNDSLLLLDEAHCSKAFARTLERVGRYREESPLALPFAFVEMTATPSRKHRGQPFRLDDADRANAVLSQRLGARKSTRFVPVKAKAADAKGLAKAFAGEARDMAKKPGIRRIAVMVNRVDTARAVAEEIGVGDARVTLVVGRMRPVDRAGVDGVLGEVKAGAPRNPEDPPHYVVSTQCLEVGADLDFDGLVTELASMDAMLQRFGRLNRLGTLPGGAFGCIVAPASDAKKPDPIYGEGLTRTRDWLEPLFEKKAELDFALERDGESVPELWRLLGAEHRAAMTPPAPVCPMLLPSHLDALVQTSPKPLPEPAVEYFLHGKQDGAGEVSVVWRSDLREGDEGEWRELILQCPVTINEALAVKIWALRKWMLGEEAPGQSDLEGGEGAEEPATRRRIRGKEMVLICRGEEQFYSSEPQEVRPGDTVVIPGTNWPRPELGHIPPHAVADVGDEAYFAGRNVVRLRLHEGVMAAWPEVVRNRFLPFVKSNELDWGELQEVATETLAESETAMPLWLRKSLEAIRNETARRFELSRYPNIIEGWVIESKTTLLKMMDDTGRDDGSRGAPVGLEKHTKDVVAEAQRFAGVLLEGKLAATVVAAARWHDSGKADERFQSLLYGGDKTAAQLSGHLRAKGEYATPWERKRSFAGSGLPVGFRHELTSLLFAKGSEDGNSPLALHLIASHHGYCRPFAPVILDGEAEEILYRAVGLKAAERASGAAHRLESGVPERFWELTRKYGWWGLAYLEALLRLADWKASTDEQRALQGGS